MRLIGRHYAGGGMISVGTDGDRIARVDSLPQEAVPAAVPWIAPGFVDLQINGFARREFADADLSAEHVSQLSLGVERFGVTQYCPTLTTHTHEVLRHALSTVQRACEADRQVARCVAGIHLEGPYLSAEDGPRGAHRREAIRPPDLDEFLRLQEAAGGRIRLLTMAPEYAGAAAFIQRLVQSGVVVAIGHTAADASAIQAAVDAGARLSTHLGNGSHGQIRRHPNYIWDQLAEDRLWASLIVDGHHLPGSVVKSFVRAKTPARCILVSDLAGMAGLPPGRYKNTGLGDVEVLDNGCLMVGGQRQLLAGASLPIGVGVANVMRFAGVTLEQAIAMAATRPAELIGADVVRIEPGAPANLVQFDLPGRMDRGPSATCTCEPPSTGEKSCTGRPSAGWTNRQRVVGLEDSTQLRYHFQPAATEMPARQYPRPGPSSTAVPTVPSRMSNISGKRSLHPRFPAGQYCRPFPSIAATVGMRAATEAECRNDAPGHVRS